MLEEYNDPANEKRGYIIHEWHFTCPNCHEEVWMAFYPELREILVCSCNTHIVVTGFELTISPDGKKGTKFTCSQVPLWKIEEARRRGDVKPKARLKNPDIASLKSLQFIPETEEGPLNKTLESLKRKNPENPENP